MFRGFIYLIKLCFKYKKSTIFYLFLRQLVDSASPLINIVMPKLIIDEMTYNQNIFKLLLYVSVFLISLCFSRQLSLFFGIKFYLAKLEVENKFENTLCEKLLNTDIETLESPDFLDLQKKAERFIYAEGYGFGGILDKVSAILSIFIVFIGIISIMFILNPIVVITFVVLSALNAFAHYKSQQANIKLDLERPVEERKINYYLNLLSNSSKQKEIRIYKMGNLIVEKYNDRKKVLKDFFRRTMYNNFYAQIFMSVTGLIQQATAYAYLIIEFIGGQITFGSFTMYLNAINSFSSSMDDVVRAIIDIRQYSEYYVNVDEYLNLKSNLRTVKKRSIDINKNFVFEFENVYFKYPKSDDYVIKNLSLRIYPHTKIAIIGENGAGKSTFIKLLSKMYKPTKGTIKLNGYDIYDYDYDEYMKLFAIVFQDYNLFAFSVEENISISEKNEQKVKDSLIKSGFDIKLLPKGLQNQISREFDEKGFIPSGGEGQKIAIARAIYKDAPIVIMDEPTAALDPRSEYKIFKDFKALSEDKISIFISHRLSISKFCDTILVFKSGQIVEMGNHDELIALKGLYYELFNIQSKFYN